MASNQLEGNNKGPGIPVNVNKNKLHKTNTPQSQGNTGGTTGQRGQV